MKEGEIHETCGIYRREVKFLQGFFLGGKHEVRKEGRKEGRDGGREGGRKEGRKEGTKWFGEQRP